MHQIPMQRVLPSLTGLVLMSLVPIHLLAAPAPSDKPEAPPGTLPPAVVDAIEKAIAASGAEVGIVLETLDGELKYEREADRVFHAASTMKVAVMVELFRQAREGRLTLDDTVLVQNRFRSIVDGSPYELGVTEDSEGALYRAIGERRSLRELCELMITVSSNLATNLLIERIGASAIQATMASIGADDLRVLRGVEDNLAFEKGLNNTTTARALATVLSAIAHERAVSPEASREMIAILARQTVTDAIPAGLPPGTRVAHKTGKITRIHHDAGIVFAPRPYVLVLLVRGIDDRKASARLMADITRRIHEAVQADSRATRP